MSQQLSGPDTVRTCQGTDQLVKWITTTAQPSVAQGRRSHVLLNTSVRSTGYTSAHLCHTDSHIVVEPPDARSDIWKAQETLRVDRSLIKVPSRSKRIPRALMVVGDILCIRDEQGIGDGVQFVTLIFLCSKRVSRGELVGFKRLAVMSTLVKLV